MRLSGYIKLGSIGGGKISIANRVPTNGFVVLLVLSMGENGGTNVMIVIDRVLYNIVCSVIFRAGLDTRLYNNNKGIRRVKTYMNEYCNEERYFTCNKNNAILVKTAVNKTRYIALRVLLLQ